MFSRCLLLLLLLLPAAAFSEKPSAADLLDRVSGALGGPRGGLRVLDKGRSLDFVFVRTVRDAVTTEEVQAGHRLVRAEGGRKQRLDIRVLKPGGVDSASVVDGDSGWLLLDGAAHEVDAAAIRSRLGEFMPERIFSVPLALGAEGAKLVGDASLSVEERLADDGKRVWVLLGVDGDGVESVRMEVADGTWLPLEVAFRAPVGHVVYRYGDFRTIADGLVLPFEREFERNGIRVSHTEVRRLSLRVDLGRLFEREQVQLKPLPVDR